MAETSINIDVRELQRFARAQKLRTAGKILEGATPMLTRLLLQAEAEIKGNLTGDVLNVRSGVLRASVGIERPHIEGSSLVARVGVLKPSAAQKYAEMQLHGGVITAKSGKFLAIPLPPALTAAGVARYPSPLRESLKAAYPAGTFVAKGVLFGKLGFTKKGRQKVTGIGQFGGGRSGIVALFALKRNVRIPAHPYMETPILNLLTNTRTAMGNYLAGELAVKS